MTKDGEQVTKNQHYVPKFYLRKFVNNEGKLEILDCERRKIVTPRSPKSVCNEEFFYSANNQVDEVSQVIEKELMKIESSISNVYDEISLRFTNFEQITEEDKMNVATFMSLQYLRGPYMRKQINRLDEQLIKQITKWKFSSPHINNLFDKYEQKTGEKFSKKQRNEITEFAKSEKYNVKINNASHLNLLGELSGFRNLLFGKEWKVFVSKSSKKFITSDNPVVELFPEWTGKVFYGPDFLQRTHQFAMTPEILIIATDPKKLPKIGEIKRKTLFDNNEHNALILKLNFTQGSHSTEFAYANNKEFLQNLIDGVNLFDKQRDNKLAQIIRASR